MTGLALTGRAPVAPRLSVSDGRRVAAGRMLRSGRQSRHGQKSSRQTSNRVDLVGSHRSPPFFAMVVAIIVHIQPGRHQLRREDLAEVLDFMPGFFEDFASRDSLSNASGSETSWPP